MIQNVAHKAALAAAIPNASQTPRRTPSSEAQAGTDPGAQYNFAEIFGAASDQRGPLPTTTTPAISSASLTTAVQAAAAQTVAATAALVSTGKLNPTAEISLAAPQAANSSPAASTPAGATTAAAAAANTAATAASSAATGGQTTTPTPATVANPGIQALVTAIMNGSFKPTYVTDPSKLQETNPAGTDYMGSFYFASDQTAAQLAQLLGGTVVQMAPFGQDKGWSEPVANFIQLPNGQTFNAADVAYYARTGAEGPNQLIADITQTINEGSAWTSYYQNGGSMPTFTPGYVGPAISGMTYPSNMIAPDGTVINPAMAT